MDLGPLNFNCKVGAKHYDILRKRENQMQILVTGGSGFVGQNLTKRLIADGHNVTIVSTGTEPKIDGVKKVLYMGLTGIDMKECQGMDVVIHQMANNDTRCTDKNEMERANVFGPIKLFEVAANFGCKKFVYASSTAVYGASPAPYYEDRTEIKPLNVYGESKAKFDAFAMRFSRDYHVYVTGLRYCNIYGPGEEHKGKRMSMIGQIIRQIKAGVSPKLFTDGEQKRDWIYVDDVVNANLLAMSRDEGKFGEIYNIGSGKAETFNDIVKTTVKNMIVPLQATTPEYIDCPFKDEYQDFTECCIDKAKRDLGFEPKYDLQLGIKEYLKHLS
jgi:ADP-L-glycero-D-manno-heptose 6-epimerase